MLELDLSSIKAQWNLVLDELMNQDRVLWLAFFDARLVSYDGQTLTLDFRDVTKFEGEHDFKSVRKPEQFARLQHAIEKILGIKPIIREV